MRSIILAFMALTGFVSFTQSQSLNTSSWRLSDFQFSMGTEVANTSPVIRPIEIANFVPGSQFIELSQPGNMRTGWIPAWSSDVLTMQLGLHPVDKVSGESKRNRTLRLGLTAQGFNTQIYTSSAERSYRMDTLLNSSNSTIYGYVDSVYHHDVYAEYSGNAIKLDGSFVWSTNPERRFSLYGGVGANAGLLINARTDVYSNEWSSEQITDWRGYQISGNYYDGFDYQTRQEQFRNKTGWSATLFVPLGVDFRLGKSKPFWNQLHLFTEMRPCVTILSIPETKAYAIPGIQNMWGFKVHW